ncbi:MAG: hypothetical protein E3J71_08920 [Candidatus Stahlbacteria bacterium]|nr:MAG: hypothetical protein E3J71_08920 [Candidatus Stahlbacteria bacterium]
MKTRPYGLGALLGVCLTVLSYGALEAGELHYVLELPLSELSLEGAGEYTLVSFEGASYDAPPGYPLIPFITKRYLLPRGTKVADVRLEALSVKTTYVEAPVYPAQPPRPLTAQKVEFVGPREEVYTSSTPVSDFEAQVLYQVLLEGERVALIAVRPLRYTPAEARLEVAEQMVLTVGYEPDPGYTPPVGITPSQQRRLNVRIKALVENTEVFTPRVTFQPAVEKNYRHAIVTPSLLRGEFQKLADWNTARGVRDTVVALEAIASSFSGRDLAEQIRNFVIFAHERWGVEYLLLGGDEGLVPTRDCFVASYDGNSRDTIPTDMYFGCLDGDWDANANNTFGEMNDEVDLSAEVTVGRACVNDIQEAGLFVGKVVVYQDNPPQGFASKLMLPSEILWPDRGYSGDGTNDAIADLAHPGTSIAKMYETQGTLTRNALEDSLNAGVGLVHHCAHGNEIAISCGHLNGEPSFYNWQARGLINAGKMPVYVAISCLVGAFDYDGFGGCLVEAFQWAEHGGTVAWVGNSRYGWGTPPTRGPSECLDVSFFEEVYGLDNPEIGPALATAKEENAGWGNVSYGRWSIYELNLHGDPAMPVHSREPSEFIVSHPPVVEGPQTLYVTVSSQAGYPVEGMLVCARQSPNVYAWAYTDASGVAALEISPTPGFMELRVTGANHYDWVDKNILVGVRRAELTISPDTTWLDAEIEPLSSSFTVSSTGTDSLVVTQISPYQATWIDSIYPTDCVLAAGEGRQIEFFVDTTGFPDYIYLGKIRILSNDPDRTLAYHPVKLIKGDWPDIEITPDTLAFNMPAGDSLTIACDVTNEGRAGLEVSSISSSTPWIKEIDPTSLSIPSGDSLSYESVSITIDTAGLGFGIFEGGVLFETNDPDEEQRRLPVRLNIGEPDITLSPDTLHFFFSWEDQSRNKTEDDLTVSNEGDRILEVTNVIPTRQWISVSPPTAFDVEPDGSHDVHVTVVPEKLGQGVYNANIRVYSNDPDEPMALEPVKLLVEEIPPRICCKPDTAVMDRQTMRGRFWVYNLGMRDLVVKEISTETPWIYALYPKSFILRGQDSAYVTMIGDASKVGAGPPVGIVLVKSNDTHNPEWEEPVKIGGTSGIAEALPTVFELSRVVPNPLRGRCAIRFAVPRQASVSLALYDVTGQKVRTFVDGSIQPGYHFVLWSGEDDLGRPLPQGVYLLRMHSPDYSAVEKLVLLR